MHPFWNTIIKPLLEIIKPNHIVEVGSEKGINTRNLMEFCQENEGILYSIDPNPQFDVNEWKVNYGEHFVFLNSLSLNALPQINNYDAVLIDGDHNWYTVFHELKIIEKQTQKNQQDFPLIILHDIGWPYGRRDLYYYPDNIPDAYKKPYKQKGLKPGSFELLEKGGLNVGLNNSIYENDLQNGVLTAVEDFMEASNANYRFYKIPGIYGLGVLFSANHKNRDKLIKYLNAFQPSPELEKYIEVIENMRINTAIADTEKSASLAQLTINEKLKNQEIERLKEDLEKANQQISILENQAEQLEGSLTDKETKNNELETLIFEAGKANELLKNNLQYAKENTKRLNEKLEISEQQLTELEQQKNQAENKAAILETKIKELEAQIRNANKTNESLKINLKNAEEDTRNINKQREEKEQQCSILEQQKTETEESKAILEAKVDNLESEISNLKSQYEDLETCSRNIEKKYEHATHLLQKKTREMTVLINTFEKVKKAFDVLLSSQRWKTGNLLGKIKNKILFKAETEMPSDYIVKQFASYGKVKNTIKTEDVETNQLNYPLESETVPAKFVSPEEAEGEEYILQPPLK